MLIVENTMTKKIKLSEKMKRLTWEGFIQGGTSHSGNAGTLPYVMNRCEEEKVEYTLRAAPGKGYYISQGSDLLGH